MDMVWMRHPQLPEDQLICQPEEATAGHRVAGWEATDPPPPDQVLEGPWGVSALENDVAAVEMRSGDIPTASDNEESK
jgi:hypothetical protein